MENMASICGGETFVEGVYIYVKNKNLTAGRISYESEMRKLNNRLDGIVVESLNDHTNAPVASRPEALRIRTARIRYKNHNKFLQRYCRSSL